MPLKPTPRFGLRATIEYGLTAYADQDGMDEATRIEVLAGLLDLQEMATELWLKVKAGRNDE